MGRGCVWKVEKDCGREIYFIDTIFSVELVGVNN